MFVCLIICTFQLVFSARTVFFSLNESVGTVFRLVFSAKRTADDGDAPHTKPVVMDSTDCG